MVILPSTDYWNEEQLRIDPQSAHIVYQDQTIFVLYKKMFSFVGILHKVIFEWNRKGIEFLPQIQIF